MFLLTLCVCVPVYVCVRDLLLFPNLASPLSLPDMTKISALHRKFRSISSTQASCLHYSDLFIH